MNHMYCVTGSGPRIVAQGVDDEKWSTKLISRGVDHGEYSTKIGSQGVNHEEWIMGSVPVVVDCGEGITGRVDHAV